MSQPTKTVATTTRESIINRAQIFVLRWTDPGLKLRERAHSQLFLSELFAVFGRDLIAQGGQFEHILKREVPEMGDLRIDLFWPGIVLVEMKSPGEDLAKAKKQALGYVRKLPAHEKPRWVMVSDFDHILVYDLGESPDLYFDFATPEEKEELIAQFKLADLPRRYRALGFLTAEEPEKDKDGKDINEKAVIKLGKLHDSLKDAGYSAKYLETFLVRILFCLFAEDTGIFDNFAFTAFVQSSRSHPEGLGARLVQLFDTLHTAPEERMKTTPKDLARFDYINGGLFEESIRPPIFSEENLKQLVECCRFKWANISPAVFGSLFQCVLNPDERRELGAHYTSEENILKAVGPLFLDALKIELDQLEKRSTTPTGRQELSRFLKKLSRLKLLDPACGCGNFLVIAYRELRALELKTLELLYPLNGGKRDGVLNVADLIEVSVEQMYGIEIEEFPRRIAQTALWLTDHQENMKVSRAMGQNFLRIPLTQTAHITKANALKTDWRTVLLPADCTHIVGNPPFIGSKMQEKEQRGELLAVFGKLKGAGILDYVSAWFRLAAEYMKDNPKVRTAFVSTNSITQGEQVGLLWGNLINEFGVHLDFAHRTFRWTNAAPHKAAVHCVIIGFSRSVPVGTRLIFDENLPDPIPVKTYLSPYLLDSPFEPLLNRSTPICPSSPKIGIGNKPIDGGWYLFTEQERNDFLAEEPGAARFFRVWLGSDEFINGWCRYCLWLGNATEADLRKLPECRKRIEAVRKFRLGIGPAKDKDEIKERHESTQKLAEHPTRFHVENMPKGDSLVIPEVSSENRRYIPIGFVGPDIMCSNLVKLVPDATLYHFGVISSKMHMAWVRIVCGRMKSDFRYSARIVYNNFPWPDENDENKAPRARVEAQAKEVLTVRKEVAEKAGTVAAARENLAELYGAQKGMSKELEKSHAALDRSVDSAYGYKGKDDDASRVEFLLERYRKLKGEFDLKAPSLKPKRAKKSKTE